MAMDNILKKYGIKEVADVTFYNITSDGQAGAPVLYLDTLKVSTIEQTAEEVTANGGKGNAPLILWDYGKEITVTIEDALFSAKSMAMMFGGHVAGDESQIKKTIMWTCGAGQTSPPTTVEGPQGKKYPWASGTSVTVYDSTGAAVTSYTPGEIYYVTGMLQCDPDESQKIVISANTFPGTYYVTGDTYARSEITGQDEFFQFVIPKAKIQSENTITLEADGDPSVFNMNLRVLRPADGVMMKLIKYNVESTQG